MPSQKQNRCPPKRPLSDRSDEETNAEESRPQPLVTIEACDPALTIWCRCAVWDNRGDGYPQCICNLTTLKRREQCLLLWIAGAHRISDVAAASG
jgi:hypothetical protein